MKTPDAVFAIAMSLIPGLGLPATRNILNHFGSARQFFEAEKAEFEAAGEESGVYPAYFELKKEKEKYIDRACNEFSVLTENEIKILTYDSTEYPSRLREIEDAPPVIYFKGKGNLDASKVLAVIGSRRVTAYGLELCQKLMDVLSDYPVLVISGLAFGIDIAAQRAALSKGMAVAGVLAHGHGTLYPASHHQEAEAMLERGGLVSEFFYTEKPFPGHFPRRNRIIAGLCDACLVVESADRGGALITARQAFSYNRSVLAFPGRAGDPYSAGCNSLIHDLQAQLVRNPADVLAQLGLESPAVDTQGQATGRKITQAESRILHYLVQNGRVSADDLLYQFSDVFPDLYVVLLEMEIKGMLRVLPGRLYEKTSRIQGQI